MMRRTRATARRANSLGAAGGQLVFGLIVTSLAAVAAALRGGEVWLLGVAAFGWAMAVGTYLRGSSITRGTPRSLITGSRDSLLEQLESVLSQVDKTGAQTAVFVMRFDETDNLHDKHGRRRADAALAIARGRIRSALRDTDLFATFDPVTLCAALAPVTRLDLEATIQIATRIQHAASEPVSEGGDLIDLDLSIGFSLSSRQPGIKASELLTLAEVAMEDAHRNGPGAIRAWAQDMGKRRIASTDLHRDLTKALENCEVSSFYQPQIDTSTGLVSGFETLARWNHPGGSLIPPTEFMPIVHEAGLTARLGEVVLYQALSALQSWDRSGAEVPRVGINVAAAELRDPKLAERIQWDLERFDLSPDRLTVEIPETVFADDTENVVTRNIRTLDEMGCRIDLDDFGIGHASIAHIHRFAVDRIKIDRSFVSRIDQDRTQRKIVSAIVGMADELGVETLAEGVENMGEHAMLVNLGCRHVQGFGIARPMPAEEVAKWSIARSKTQKKTPYEAVALRDMRRSMSSVA